MKKIFSIALLSFVGINSAFAINEIVTPYRSAKTLGMGGTRTTTGMYADALFGGNPALHAMPETWKIQIISPQVEANSNLISSASKFSSISGAGGADVFTKVAEAGLVGKNQHEAVSNVTGFYTPRFFSDNTAFAFGILASQRMNVMLRTNTDLGIQGYVDVGPGIGLAKRFWDNTLFVGVNVRATYRLAADQDFRTIEFLGGKKLALSDIGGQGGGIDGDIGGYYRLPWEIPIARFSVGASVNNVAASHYDLFAKTLVKKITKAPPSNERSAALGARIDFNDFAILTENNVAVEVQDIGVNGKATSFFKRVHMGAETKLLWALKVRGGFNQGYYTAGLGLYLPLIKLDLSTYGEEIGTLAGQLEDRRYVARIGFEI